MTPEQALHILVQLASMAPVPKQDHVTAEQAAVVIQTAIADVSDVPGPPKPNRAQRRATPKKS